MTFLQVLSRIYTRIDYRLVLHFYMIIWVSPMKFVLIRIHYNLCLYIGGIWTIFYPLLTTTFNGEVDFSDHRENCKFENLKNAKCKFGCCMWWISLQGSTFSSSSMEVQAQRRPTLLVVHFCILILDKVVCFGTRSWHDMFVPFISNKWSLLWSFDEKLREFVHYFLNISITIC